MEVCRLTNGYYSVHVSDISADMVPKQMKTPYDPKIGWDSIGVISSDAKVLELG